MSQHFCLQKVGSPRIKIKTKPHMKARFVPISQRVTISIVNINLRLTSFPHRKKKQKQKQKVMLALLSLLIYSD